MDFRERQSMKNSEYLWVRQQILIYELISHVSGIRGFDSTPYLEKCISILKEAKMNCQPALDRISEELKANEGKNNT